MAWIEIIHPGEATGELHEVYRRIESERGKTANVLRIQSLDPRALKAHLELYLAVVFGHGDLPRPTRELIAVAVSAANGCVYCLRHHAEALDFYWKNRAAVDALCADPDGAALPPAARAVVDYALKLTRTPDAVEERDVENLRDSGLDDPQILQVAQTTAYFNFVNRLNQGLGVEYDEDELRGYRY